MLQQPAGLIALQQVATQRTPTPCQQVMIYTQLAPSAHSDKVISLCAREVLTSRAKTPCCESSNPQKPSGFLLVLIQPERAWSESCHNFLMHGVAALQCFAVALCLAASPVSEAARSFSIHNNNFVRDSKNFQIISGR